MHALQGSFGWLRMPLAIGDDERHGNMLEICIHLYNLHTHAVGINQIKTIYESLWTEGAQREIWDGFETMLFGEQCCRDCVLTFHRIT